MERDKKETLDYHNFDDWKKLNFEPKIINFLEIESLESDHGKMVRDHYKLVAPLNSNAYLGNMTYRVSGDEVVFCNIHYYDSYIPIGQFVKELDIHIIGASLSNNSSLPQPLIDYLKKLPVIYVGSAGNNGSEGISGKFRHLGFMSGAIYLDNGEIRKESYSAVGELMDFATLHSWGEGTSFSQPVLAGMNSWIMSKYGVISQAKMKEVLISISIDAGEEGRDPHFGHGVPILPEDGIIEMLENEPIEEIEVINNMNKSNLIIVLDPGHRRDTPGKRSNGFLEWEFNDEVVRKTYKLLKDDGYNVEITLDTIIHPWSEETLYGRNKNLDFRATSTNYLKNNNNHVIFISIHANAHSDSNVRGYEIFTAYGEQDRNSELLAVCMLSKAIQYLGVGTKTPNRGNKDADFYVLKNTITPAILIEHDFFTNKEAREEMLTEEYKNKASIAIMEGIELYVDKKNNTEGTTLDVTKENVNGNVIHYIVGDTPKNSYYGQSEQSGNIRYIDASPLNIMFGIGDTTVKETGKYGSNGTFSWGKAVNGIMKFGDEVLGERSSRYWSPDGKHYPQSVLCYYRDGTFGVEKIKTASEISKPIWWAVGGIGLISQYGYNPDSEGFKKVWSLEEEKFIDYSDVLRFTDHMSIGVDYKDRVFLIRSWQVYRKTTIEHGKLLNLKYMVGLDSGGSTQMVTPEWSRPSDNYEKYVSPTRKVYNKILVKDL